METRRALVTGAASGIGAACAQRLAADGVHVIAADFDQAGLDALDGVETILTDLFMPNMEGFELIKEVRALRPRIRIIAMSGAFGGEFLAGAERAGVDATLRKPIQQETLRTFLTCARPLGDRLLAREGV